MSRDVSANLLGSLIENLRGAPEEWNALAQVLVFDGDRVERIHGYVYGADGKPVGAAASPYLTKDAVAAYLDSHYKPGDARPVKLLVQFDRVTGQYEVAFEDSDTNRWAATPENFYSLPEELRPVFD